MPHCQTAHGEEKEPELRSIVAELNPDRWRTAAMEVGSALFPLPKREVHVWLTDFEGPISSVYDLLDREEQLRASRFKLEVPRQQFIISHAFLRLALAQYLGIAARDIGFRLTAYGKPELQTVTDLNFNLSHTEGMAVLALARGRRVGVDVERVRENLHPLELADRFFSSSEAAWLRSQPPAQRIPSFFACWTAKEAYIKACGNGLSQPLSGFSLIPQSANQPCALEVRDNPEPSAEWSVWQLDLGPNLRGALAAEGRELTLSLRSWRWR